MGTEAFPDRPADDPVQHCPAAQPTHWIEIELLDDSGLPLPHQEYLLTLPGGEQLRGYLDADGFVRVPLLAEGGECQVAFPGIDARAWRLQGSGPAREPQIL